MYANRQILTSYRK